MPFPFLKTSRRFATPAAYTHSGITHMTPQPHRQVIAGFLDAVISSPEDVWAFVSCVYSPRLDIDELRETLGAGAKIKVAGAQYLDGGRIFTRSVYVENPQLSLRRVLHMQMIKERGAWKIYSVEQENVQKNY